MAQHGSVAGFGNADTLNERSRFGELDCDILIPAALEQQITEANAGKIRAKIIFEGANGPTTPTADDILHDKGGLVVPDVIANAGGVTVSYFEWVQDFSSFFWTEDEINQRLTRIIGEAFNSVWQLAQEKRCRCARRHSSSRAPGCCRRVKCAAFILIEESREVGS